MMRCRCISALIILKILISCERPPCRNTNRILNVNLPDSKAYNQELSKRMNQISSDNLSFWIEGYASENDLKKLHLKVQGDGLCADLILRVKDSSRGIEGVVGNKARGYIGAQLEDLRFDTVRKDHQIFFVFRKVARIID